MKQRVLEVENLSVSFGGLKAVQGVNFYINEGAIIGLIGPNGAGKTTIFNLLTGVYKPTTGDIFLDDRSILNKKTWQINEMGIARTFQNIRLFKDMSVIDNVKTAMGNNLDYSLLSGVLRLPSYRKQEREATQRAQRLLQIVGLHEHTYDLACNLPYGKQRKLEIARAVASNPHVLLLDEPAAGMNPTETQELLQTIKTVRDKFNLSVLLIEHDMNFVMGICEHIFVLDYGRVIASGTGKEIQNDPKVITAYLGGE